MKVGAFYFPTDYGIDISELARALEQRGFEVAFRVRAHAHSRQPEVAVPGRRRAAQALFPHARSVRGACRSPPRRPRTSSSAPASASSRSTIRSSPPSRSLPSTSSRAGASSSRIGGGWNVEEMENHGAKYDTRFKLLRERVARHEGDLDQGRGRVPRRVRELRQDLVLPKPKQRPHPPIFLHMRAGLLARAPNSAFPAASVPPPALASFVLFRRGADSIGFQQTVIIGLDRGRFHQRIRVNPHAAAHAHDNVHLIHDAMIDHRFYSLRAHFPAAPGTAVDRRNAINASELYPASLRCA